VILCYAKTKNIPKLKLLDIISPGIALGYSIGRIGCFLNGCCFGKPTDLPWGLVYSSVSPAGNYYPGIALHPTQLYAMVSMFMVFVILAILFEKKKCDGQIFYWLLIFYSVYRFLVEFLRYCPHYWLSLTPSQWIVVFLFIFGIFGLVSKNTKLLPRR
jgi:phosphatidylglycerol:prolipoprotein diacylglycerol transferase